MTKSVVLFVGLPGAGKTVLAEKVRRLFPQQAIVLDDPSVLKREDQQNFENTLAQCREHPIVLITDPMLCRVSPHQAFEQVREWFEPEIEIGVVLFSDDLDACKANVKYRNDVQGIERLITDQNMEWFASGYKYVNWVYACINNGVDLATSLPYQGHNNAVQVS